MADVARATLGLTLAWLGMMAAVAFLRLLPLGEGTGRLPGPDVMVVITFAWVLRRPAAVPVVAVAAVFVMADILFMRPVGLWAAAAVLGTQALRSREPGLREVGFAVEWLVVAVVIALMTLGTAAILGLTLVDQPPLGQTLIHLIATVLAYPLAIALAARPLGLRKSPNGDASLGLRS